MEKQGMERRKRTGRAGLLIFLLILIFGPALFRDGGLWAEEGAAGEEDKPLIVRIEASPANPIVNGLWSIFVLVNHPSPSEVNVKPPRFPSSMLLERVRTETRSVQGERWTRVEFLFTPQRTATVTLEPFVVTVQNRQAESSAISVRFREEVRTAKRYDPRFRWVNPASPFPVGEQGEIFLELTNWDPQKNAPRGFLQGRAPRNAILEEGSPAEGGEGFFRYAVSFIPLEGSEIILGAFSFQAEGYTLNVSGITIPVLPSPGSEAPSAETGPDGNFINETQPDEVPLNDSVWIPFPGAFATEVSAPVNPEAVFPLFRREYNRIISRVRDLWEKNQRAEALAEIRRNERDSLSGPFLVPLRKDMEQALGFVFTGNEQWQPLGISLVSWVVLGFLLLSVVTILIVFHSRPEIRRDSVQRNFIQRKSVTKGRRSGFMTVIVLVLSIGLAVIFLEVGLGNILIDRLNSSRKTAVLGKTPAYRIPDAKGAINAFFDEGQPVTVSDFKLDWCYAETGDGRFGWVPREAVIPY